MGGDAGPTTMATSRVCYASVFIFCTYFAEVILSSAPGALLPDIADELGFDSATSARVTAVGTTALCISKLTMGPVVDVMGGKYSALIGMTIVVGTVVLLGYATSIPMVAGILFANKFANAPVWAAEAVLMKVRVQCIVCACAPCFTRVSRPHEGTCPVQRVCMCALLHPCWPFS